jgi:hypothetical protein
MSSAIRDRVIDWPLWWFARLEAAVERGDYLAAAEAQRQLVRLGVDVRFRVSRPTKKEVAGVK